MSLAACTKCWRMGRLIEAPARDLWVEYYTCDRCGHVWTYEKAAPNARPNGVTPCRTFRVMHPWGPDKGRQATVQSVHATVADAFDAVDRFATDLALTGAPSDAIELVVADDDGEVIPRPGTH
jgi:hypothetical protein